MKAIIGIVLLGLLVAGCSAKQLVPEQVSSARNPPAVIAETRGAAIQVEASEIDEVNSIEKDIDLTALDDATTDLSAIDNAFE